MDPFISEIRMLSFYFAPKGWAQCNGQLLAIAQNTALFSLLGTTYGGDGRTTFGLPDLRGRAPIHFGTDTTGGGGNFVLGQMGGQENVTLNSTQMPVHSHVVTASSTVQDTASPSNAYPGGGGLALYQAQSNPVALAPQAVGTAGGNTPHSNLPPYLTVNFCIATQGVFPSRN
jgi:microcystin-dependent protein